MHDPEAATGAAVDVWVAPLDLAPGAMASLVASLSTAERARSGRYRSPRDTRRFSAARGWLRHVLATELAAPPAAIRLSDGPGKPRLLGWPGPCFNLSHSGDLALIAVATREVGVDVEDRSAGHHGLDVVNLACNAAEAVSLGRLPPSERADAFLCRWTAKEAYLKATGQGLSVPPDRVEVGVVGVGAAAPMRVTGDRGPSRWWVRQLRPHPGYVGAVAAEGPDWEVSLRSTEELCFEADVEPAPWAGC